VGLKINQVVQAHVKVHHHGVVHHPHLEKVLVHHGVVLKVHHVVLVAVQEVHHAVHHQEENNHGIRIIRKRQK
jgi:hypothetical protein